MKESITRAEYLQLVGLLALATQHNKRLDEIQQASESLLGISPDEHGGHVGDAVYGGFGAPNADTLLARLKIAVSE